MARAKIKFVCQECGYEAPRWLGKCPDCRQWNSLLEVVESKKSQSHNATSLAGRQSAPMLLKDVTSNGEVRFTTGIKEFNRVLGGGIVPGEMVLIGGDPGIGKSTLLLQMAFLLTQRGIKVLYVTGEESLQQTKLRANRLGLDQGDLYVVAETEVDIVIQHISALKPQVVIVDSIQTMLTTEIGASPGSVSQIRETTARLIQVAKMGGIAMFLVGHVTKEGSIGPAA